MINNMNAYWGTTNKAQGYPERRNKSEKTS